VGKTRCPKCGAEIDHLMVYAMKRHLYTLRIEEDGMAVYHFLGESPAPESEEFYCPVCGATLFTDLERAKEFLARGGGKE
jgi:predicted RNA-binding Zn-ribbon protein involved in translation (DUF1610 family)